MNLIRITKNPYYSLLAAIFVISSFSVNTSLAQQNDKAVPLEEGKLLIATCQLPISGSVPTNAEWIRGQMRKASAQNAAIAHFPECALSGYSGVAYKNMDNFDWKQLHAETESIMKLADDLDLWVVLGSAHRLTGPNKPHNCLYVISPQGKIVTRYDKRFCTSGDLKHYSPGDYFATFEVNGVRCGLLICYDVRFPELYRQYHKLGVQVMFHSFHNAGMTEDNILPKIMPTTVQARAASNYMFVSANNSCVKHSWQSFFATPNGLVEKRLPLDEPGVMVNLADTQKKYYDASRRYRLECIEGKYNSGDAVDDPRSNDRQNY